MDIVRFMTSSCAICAFVGGIKKYDRADPALDWVHFVAHYTPACVDDKSAGVMGLMQFEA